MAANQDFKLRFMQVDELDRVSELIHSLQKYQQIAYCPRLPSKEDLVKELIHKDEKTGKFVPNNYGTYTVVAIDLTRLSEPNKQYIVGYLIYSQVISIIHGRHFYMNSFFIDEKYRRRGLGKKFMEFMRIHALATGNKHVDVPFMNNNHQGQSFYKSHGAYLVNEEYQLVGKEIEDSDFKIF